MARPLPVIIDTDPGVDDALALLLAAASPELEVLAITTVGGNVGIEQVTANARSVAALAWSGRRPPPIHAGAGRAVASAEEVHGTDGLGGAAGLRRAGGELLYPPAAPVSNTPALEAIAELVRRRPGEVTLITLGPLTNAAALFQADPEAARGLREAVVMGGAFREPGNITATAEFNMYVDAEAAQAVCDSGARLRWVPTDVTHRCLLTAEAIEGLPDTPAGRLVRHAAPYGMEFHERRHGEHAMYLHDPVAVAAAIWPELLRTCSMRVDVETGGRLTRGMTVADFRAPAYRTGEVPNADVSLAVDAPEMVRRILARLA